MSQPCCPQIPSLCAEPADPLANYSSEDPDAFPTIITSIANSCCLGDPFFQQLEVSGLGQGDIFWQLLSGQLPPGLMFEGGTLPYNVPASIQGTPSVRGFYQFTIRASRAATFSDRTYQLFVVQVLNSTVFHVGEGIPYLTLLTARPGHPVNWSLVAGSLPAGLALAPSGFLAGTPAGPPGASSFVLEFTNIIAGGSISCMQVFQCTVLASGDYSPRACIPDLPDFSIPVTKYVDLVEDSPSLPVTVQGNGNLVQMIGSCAPQCSLAPLPGELLSKATFALDAGKTYRLSILAAGNGLDISGVPSCVFVPGAPPPPPPEPPILNINNNLAVNMTNGVLSQVLVFERLTPLTWFVFDGITVGGPTNTQIDIIGLDPTFTVPGTDWPNLGGYGAYLKEIKLENVTDAVTLLDSVF